MSQDSLEVRSSEAVAEAVSVKLWKRHTTVQPGTLHTVPGTLAQAGEAIEQSIKRTELQSLLSNCSIVLHLLAAQDSIQKTPYNGTFTQL